MIRGPYMFKRQNKMGKIGEVEKESYAYLKRNNIHIVQPEAIHHVKPALRRRMVSGSSFGRVRVRVRNSSRLIFFYVGLSCLAVVASFSFPFCFAFFLGEKAARVSAAHRMSREACLWICRPTAQSRDQPPPVPIRVKRRFRLRNLDEKRARVWVWDCGTVGGEECLLGGRRRRQG